MYYIIFETLNLNLSYLFSYPEYIYSETKQDKPLAIIATPTDHFVLLRSYTQYTNHRFYCSCSCHQNRRPATNRFYSLRC